MITSLIPAAGTSVQQASAEFVAPPDGEAAFAAIFDGAEADRGTGTTDLRDGVAAAPSDAGAPKDVLVVPVPSPHAADPGARAQPVPLPDASAQVAASRPAPPPVGSLPDGRNAATDDGPIHPGVGGPLFAPGEIGGSPAPAHQTGSLAGPAGRPSTAEAAIRAVPTTEPVAVQPDRDPPVDLPLGQSGRPEPAETARGPSQLIDLVAEPRAPESEVTGTFDLDRPSGTDGDVPGPRVTTAPAVVPRAGAQMSAGAFGTASLETAAPVTRDPKPTVEPAGQPPAAEAKAGEPVGPASGRTPERAPSRPSTIIQPTGDRSAIDVAGAGPVERSDRATATAAGPNPSPFTEPKDGDRATRTDIAGPDGDASRTTIVAKAPLSASVTGDTGPIDPVAARSTVPERLSRTAIRHSTVETGLPLSRGLPPSPSVGTPSGPADAATLSVAAPASRVTEPPDPPRSGAVVALPAAIPARAARMTGGVALAADAVPPVEQRLPERMAETTPLPKAAATLVGPVEQSPRALPAEQTAPAPVPDGGDPPLDGVVDDGRRDVASLAGGSTASTATPRTEASAPLTVAATRGVPSADPPGAPDPTKPTGQPGTVDEADRRPEGIAPRPHGPAAPGTQTLPLPQGMPAYWAAREAATAAGGGETDGRASAATAQSAPPRKQGPAPPSPTTAAVPLPDIASRDGAATVLPSAAPDADMTSLALAGATWAGPAQPAPVPSGAVTVALPAALPAQIAAALAARTERPVELSMITDELGALHLSLRQEGDLVHVAIRADQSATLDLLRRHGDVLIHELRTAGFSGATLSFGDGGGARDRAIPSAPTAPDPPALADASPPHATLLSATVRLLSGSGLDVRI